MNCVFSSWSPGPEGFTPPSFCGPLTFTLVGRWECRCCSLLCCRFTNSFFLLFPLTCLSPPLFLTSSHSFCVHHRSFPTSSCRYLTPSSKTDYYVTEWVEDVNKNTEGPYIRYYLRPLRIPPRIHFAYLFTYLFILCTPIIYFCFLFV